MSLNNCYFRALVTLLLVAFGGGCSVIVDNKIEPAADAGPACGDGLIDTGAGEVCDDGNRVDDDGCDSDCQFSCTSHADCDDGEICNGEEVCNSTTHACGVAGVLPPNGTACVDGGSAGNCMDAVCVIP